jgi:hypothetical protein
LFASRRRLARANAKSSNRWPKTSQRGDPYGCAELT